VTKTAKPKVKPKGSAGVSKKKTAKQKNSKIQTSMTAWD